jgi:acylphosphatase
MSNVRAHVLVSGFVQGVFFRSDARQEAQSLGVTGWVMNRFDGRVEAVFEGEKTSVQRLVDWCRKGPPGAVVKDVEVAWEDYRGEFDSFLIKY